MITCVEYHKNCKRSMISVEHAFRARNCTKTQSTSTSFLQKTRDTVSIFHSLYRENETRWAESSTTRANPIVRSLQWWNKTFKQNISSTTIVMRRDTQRGISVRVKFLKRKSKLCRPLYRNFGKIKKKNFSSQRETRDKSKLTFSVWGKALSIAKRARTSCTTRPVFR